jgi:CheY-like chemotaxis protein/Tfp pilus assembly protein PilZ
MSHVEYAAIFVRASGARLLAAERLACSLPALLGPALTDCDLSQHASSRDLVVLLRFKPEAFREALRSRLAFWTARAGGRAVSVAGMAEAVREAFLAELQGSALRRLAVPPGELFEAVGSFFTAAGAPASRRRLADDRPMLVIDVGGPGWEGVVYDRSIRHLFLPSSLAPPIGDEVMLVLRAPGAEKPIGVKSRVTGHRPAAEAGQGKPAGFSLGIPESAPALRAILEKHAVATGAAQGVRAAPRYAVKAPVVIALGTGPEPPEPPPTLPPLGATIEYATDQELKADFIENLSQGGAFVRSSRPSPVGTALQLRFRLPNGQMLLARAVVAFVDQRGMGVRFTLDAEGEAALQAAIAHLSVRPRRAVVVHDDAPFRQQLADALVERGFEVSTASLGADGLRLVTEELRRLDLLVTGVSLPGRGSDIFVRTVRSAAGEGGPAIVVAAEKMDREKEKQLEAAGADAVVDQALGPDLVAQAADAGLELRRASRTAS